MGTGHHLQPFGVNQSLLVRDQKLESPRRATRRLIGRVANAGLVLLLLSSSGCGKKDAADTDAVPTAKELDASSAQNPEKKKAAEPFKHSAMAPDPVEMPPAVGPIVGKRREFENEKYCLRLANFDELKRLFQIEMDYEEHGDTVLEPKLAICYWGFPERRKKRPAASLRVDCRPEKPAFKEVRTAAKKQKPVKKIDLGTEGFSQNTKGGRRHVFVLNGCMVTTTLENLPRKSLDAFAVDMESVLTKRGDDMIPHW